MRSRTSPRCHLTLLPLLVAALGASPAGARTLDGGDPAVLCLLADDLGAFAPLAVEPERTQERPRGWRTLEEPHRAVHREAFDAPVSARAWATYGAFALVPLGGVYGASRLGPDGLGKTTALTLGGTLLGALPGQLLFLQPAEAGGRWAELDIAAFGAGLLLTPPLAALGTWGMGELAFEGSRDRGRAFLGALGGAAAGTLLGVALHGVLEEVVGNRPALRSLRKYIAPGFIGSGSSLGYQWSRGGPRTRVR